MLASTERDIKTGVDVVYRYMNNDSVTIENIKKVHGRKIYRWLKDDEVLTRIAGLEKCDISEIQERIKSRRGLRYPLEKRIEIVRKYMNDREDDTSINALTMKYSSFWMWIKDPNVIEGIAGLEGCDSQEIYQKLEERRKIGRDRSINNRRNNFYYNSKIYSQ